MKKITGLGEVTLFVYDAGGKLVAEYDNNFGTPQQPPQTSYVATDTLQSVRAISNQNGEVTSRRDFMPFGKELYANTPNRSEAQKYSLTGADNLRKRFTGYEKDTETGLDFAEARYYQNKHGRFTAVDPLLASGKSGNPQTFNRYTYVLNNPIILTDPDGLQAGTYQGKIYANKKLTAFSDARRKGYTRYEGPPITFNAKDGYKYEVTSNGLTNLGKIDALPALKQEKTGCFFGCANAGDATILKNSFGGLTNSATGGLFSFGDSNSSQFQNAQSGADAVQWAFTAKALAAGTVMLGTGALGMLRSGGDDAAREGFRLYHGTDVNSGLNFLNGEGLNGIKAATGKIDGPAGFFLATDAGDATFFAVRRGQGLVLQYDFSNTAFRQLTRAGMFQQPIPPGRVTTFAGNEFIVPTNAFNTFNRLRKNGEITITPFRP